MNGGDVAGDGEPDEELNELGDEQNSLSLL